VLFNVMASAASRSLSVSGSASRCRVIRSKACEKSLEVLPAHVLVVSQEAGGITFVAAMLDARGRGV
ncbi:hypothetical protein ACFYNW_38605, partial [Streptomyces virginiae]|uniref:hypothetical protein n=1 Tax=Streptomyces virginiae TaxID=1961 RepID=UPI0036E10669